MTRIMTRIVYFGALRILNEKLLINFPGPFSNSCLRKSLSQAGSAGSAYQLPD